MSLGPFDEDELNSILDGAYLAQQRFDAAEGKPFNGNQVYLGPYGFLLTPPPPPPRKKEPGVRYTKTGVRLELVQGGT